MLFATIMQVFGKSSRAKILLAEDNEINQQVAAETLQQEGFFVDIANHGKEAVEKIGGGYDVVLTSKSVPGQSRDSGGEFSWTVDAANQESP